MRYYANTSLIRSGAQRFGAAAMEMRQQARSVEFLGNNDPTGLGDWSGKGADAYRTVAEHLSIDIVLASSAFERTAVTLNMLATQLDQVNNIYRQCEQLEHQIYALQSELWGADDQRKHLLHEHISDKRYRLRQLEQQAEFIDRQANNSAGNAFAEIAATANRVYFATHEVGERISVADKVGNFFKDLWRKTEDIYEDATQGSTLGGVIGFLEGLTNSVLDTLEMFWHLSPTYKFYEVISEPDRVKARADRIFNAITHPVDTAETFIESIPKAAHVIWSTTTESIQQNLINGNAYSRGKWAGYITGILAESLLTAGIGDIGKAVKTTELVGDAVEGGWDAVKMPDRIPDTHFDAPIDDVVKVGENEGSLGPTELKSSEVVDQVFGKASTFDEVVQNINKAELKNWSVSDLNVLLDQVDTRLTSLDERVSLKSTIIRESGFSNFDWNLSGESILAFADLKITIELIEEPVLLYRRGYPGEPDGKYGLGKWWSDKDRSIEETRDELAVLEAWANPLTGRYVIELPAGVKVLKGIAAPQKYFDTRTNDLVEDRPGGALQYWLNDVDKNWLKDHE